MYKIVDGSPLSGDTPLVPTLKAPDGRPIYNQTGFYTYKAGLYNQGGGQREVFSIGASRFFRDGDTSLSIAYTHQNIDELCGMTSSTANSSYGKCPGVDYNNRVAARSIYETEHRLIASLSSTHYFFGADKPTTFNLFFERKSGLPGTLSFDTYSSSSRYKTQAFGYERNLNDDSTALLYVPSGINDPKVCWYSCTQPDLAIANETLDLLYNTYGLASYAGQIVPMGAFEFPYQTSLDLKITQVLPGFRKNDEFVITLGIQNLLNLLDDEMGVYKYPYYTRTTNIFDVQMTEDFSKYILSPARYSNSKGINSGDRLAFVSSRVNIILVDSVTTNNLSESNLIESINSFFKSRYGGKTQFACGAKICPFSLSVGKNTTSPVFENT